MQVPVLDGLVVLLESLLVGLPHIESFFFLLLDGNHLLEYILINFLLYLVLTYLNFNFFNIWLLLLLCFKVWLLVIFRANLHGYLAVLSH